MECPNCMCKIITVSFELIVSTLLGQGLVTFDLTFDLTSIQWNSPIVATIGEWRPQELIC